MTKQEAILRFAQLIKKHGVSWTSGKVPPRDHEELMECSKLLSDRERTSIMLRVQGVGSSC